MPPNYYTPPGGTRPYVVHYLRLHPSDGQYEWGGIFGPPIDKMPVFEDPKTGVLVLNVVAYETWLSQGPEQDNGAA